MRFFQTASEKKIKQNVEYLIRKIQKGFFNVIIIKGATRSGKTTLAFQICKEIANAVGVDFYCTEKQNNVFFSVKELLDQAKGVQKGVFLLDEGSFDLKSLNWNDPDLQEFNTYLDTAAKYNQTICVIMPYIEFLTYRVIRDEHTFCLDCSFDKQSLSKGFVTLYDRYDLMDIYNALRNKNLRLADRIHSKADWARSQMADMSDFIDYSFYDAQKDDAIARSREKNKTKERQDNKYEELIMNLIQKKALTQGEIAAVMGVSQSAISQTYTQIKAKHKFNQK